ncbi:hypothetical protein [Achromobacter sp. Marseille-Q0513]|uniref:hypothetical protein n=1 Tax=Achromobacter sp. Marseille-Q0513 TaxID=2829161 RepID=UPI001BA9B0DD|nr:hypothetical protein [Achromobacter sp. Marseille-Q0513]
MREFLDTMWSWSRLNEGWSTFATMLLIAVLLWGGYQLFRVCRGKELRRNLELPGFLALVSLSVILGRMAHRLLFIQ